MKSKTRTVSIDFGERSYSIVIGRSLLRDPVRMGRRRRCAMGDRRHQHDGRAALRRCARRR
jgi:hypothetical protein